MTVNHMRGAHIRVSTLLREFNADRGDRGATMVEYSLLVALIAVIAIAAVAVFGDTVGETFENIDSNIVEGIENNPEG